MKSCSICDEETSLLTCKHVGPVCYECWGSGIHDALVRKASRWEEFIQHVLADVLVGVLTCDSSKFLKYGITLRRPNHLQRESIVTDGVAS